MRLNIKMGLARRLPVVWQDPLAGIDLIARLQMDAGDGFSRGFFEDAACTVPAKSTSSLIMGAKTSITDWTPGNEIEAPVVAMDSERLSVQFDGVNDKMYSSTKLNLDNPTAYFVIRSSGLNTMNNNSLLSELGTSNLFYGYDVFLANLLFFSLAPDANASSVPAIPLTTLALITFSKTGTTRTIRYNGVIIATTGGQTAGPDPISGLIGANSTAVPPCFISDIIIQDSATPNIETIESYLASLHGIVLG